MAMLTELSDGTPVPTETPITTTPERTVGGRIEPMTNTDDSPDYGAPEFAEEARSSALLAAWQLTQMDAMRDALTRFVAYESLASSAGTQEEALGHYQAMAGVAEEIDGLTELLDRKMEELDPNPDTED